LFRAGGSDSGVGFGCEAAANECGWAPAKIELSGGGGSGSGQRTKRRLGLERGGASSTSWQRSWRADWTRDS
jgi:hypothetical protein